MPGRVQTGHGHPVVWRAVMRIHDGMCKVQRSVHVHRGIGAPEENSPRGALLAPCPISGRAPTIPSGFPVIPQTCRLGSVG